jgi:hypothetical protein
MTEEIQFVDGELAADIEAVRLGKPTDDTPTVSITCDKDGNLIGDVSHLPDHILSQLQTPESRKMIADQFRASKYGAPAAPPPKFINDGNKVDYTNLKPASMTSAEFRKLRRKSFRKWTKEALKAKRSING